MDKKYKPCPYCFCEIINNPIYEKHQGRFSVICPYCRSHRSEWKETEEECIISWNTYMRDEKTYAEELLKINFDQPALVT